MSSERTRAEQGGASGILKSRYRWVTIGTVALIFLSAFESLAVTTVMPVVSDDLDGRSLYAIAFSGPLATGIIGMVWSGLISDRRGPALPLYACVATFTASLVISGTATTMLVFVLGRLVQGLGAGGLIVAIYVVVARMYPERLQPALFAAFAAAWVVPSLVGPFVAGLVAEFISWHWVFLGVVVLVIPALALVVPSLRHVESQVNEDAAPGGAAKLAWSALAALAVLVLAVSGDATGAEWLLAAASITVTLIAVRPLLPAGTLRLQRGLPSVISLRGVTAGAFVATEVYLPFMLTENYGFRPSTAGLVLTVGALSWSIASAVQGRIGERAEHVTFLRVGTVFITIAIVAAFVTAAFDLAPAVTVAGWLFGGAGMGLMMPRMSILMFAYSTPENQGFNSSALNISDVIGGGTALSVTGLLFAAFPEAPLVAVFALAALLAVASTLIAPRGARRIVEPVA